MDKKADDTFAFDLEHRLDDFFSDSLPPQDEPPVDEPPTPETILPLKDLKSTILAIDWEINDDTLEAFIDQVDGLVGQFEADKVNHTLLRLLKSLGKYIRAHKSNAHPDAIKQLMSVYAALEESVTNHQLSQDQKEKILLETVKKFQQLKAKIVAAKSSSSASGSQKPRQAEEISGIEAIIKAINDLKSSMSNELGALREELGQLREK